jgi:hypothetical protein
MHAGVRAVIERQLEGSLRVLTVADGLSLSSSNSIQRATSPIPSPT